MKSRIFTAGLLLGGLVLAGVALRTPGVGAKDRPEPAGLTASRLAAGMLGGFRGVVADFLWLRAYVTWEREDAPKTETLLNLVTTVDPRPVYFWLNGARMLAYDLPVWRIREAGGFNAMPAEWQRRLVVQQARLALEFLERGRLFHPDEPAFWTERAGIELNQLRDGAAAAESYRRAAILPGAPYFAARLHTQLLWQLGRREEAYAWLTRLHPTLPPGDERAAAPLVLERIRRLERELAIPPGQTYQPPAGK